MFPYRYGNSLVTVTIYDYTLYGNIAVVLPYMVTVTNYMAAVYMVYENVTIYVPTSWTECITITVCVWKYYHVWSSLLNCI